MAPHKDDGNDGIEILDPDLKKVVTGNLGPQICERLMDSFLRRHQLPEACGDKQEEEHHPLITEALGPNVTPQVFDKLLNEFLALHGYFLEDIEENEQSIPLQNSSLQPFLSAASKGLEPSAPCCLSHEQRNAM